MARMYSDDIQQAALKTLIQDAKIQNLFRSCNNVERHTCGLILKPRVQRTGGRLTSSETV